MTHTRPPSVIVLLAIAVVAGGCERDRGGGKDTATPQATSVSVPPPATGPAADSLSPSATRAVPPSRTALETPASPAASHPSPAPAARSSGPASRRVRLGDIDLTGIGYDRGSATAPVVVIDFSDFGCPFCGQFSRETYPVIERDYVATGKVFFKYVPFIAGMFPHSREATRAAECAGEQNRFWPMLDRVYAAQKEWKKLDDPLPLLTGLANGVGLDTGKFSACYASRRTDARTDRATYVANRVGVRVTPSFIVDERPIEGALGAADFRRVIDAALMVHSLGK